MGKAVKAKQQLNKARTKQQKRLAGLKVANMNRLAKKKDAAEKKVKSQNVEIKFKKERGVKKESKLKAKVKEKKIKRGRAAKVEKKIQRINKEKKVKRWRMRQKVKKAKRKAREREAKLKKAKHVEKVSKYM